MHDMGVTHDDLEPRNIVVDSSGDLRLIDFELASVDHECSQSCDELLGLKMELAEGRTPSDTPVEARGVYT